MSALRAMALAALLPIPAWAIEPTPSATDPTQCTLAYDPMKTVELHEYAGDQVTLLFGKDEHFDVAMWSNKDQLIVVGKAGFNYVVVKTKGDTWSIRPFQLMVRMTREGDQPATEYEIEYNSEQPPQPRIGSPLVASNSAEVPVGEAKADSKEPPPKRCYVVRLTHPIEDAAEKVAKQRASWAQARRIKQEQELHRQQMEDSQLNTHYTFQGDRSIGPRGNPDGATIAEKSDIWDDGIHTYMHFPGNQRVPVVYTIAPDGQDGRSIDAVAEDNGLVQLPTVYEAIRLRMDGTRTLCIYNTHMQDHLPTTGTSSPNVDRGLRSDR